MERRLLFGTVLALSVIITVAAIAPALASNNRNDPAVKFYASVGTVILQLPPAPNKIGTATPAHPTDLYVAVADWEKPSAFGAAGHDLFYVALWIPQRNAYQPVAFITDNNDADFLNLIKTAWNGTWIWLERWFVPSPFFRNVITVEPDELEVSRHGDVVTANLTCEVNVYLPFPGLGGEWAAWGNQTFTLPPMSLEFRGIDTPFKSEFTATLPSGYTITETGWEKPAWVSVEISQWVGGAPFRAVGATSHNWKVTYTPP